MKKFLAICLTLTMLLSMMTVFASADEAGEKLLSDRVVALIDSCDVRGSWGIAGTGLVSLTFDEEDKTQGKASMVEVHKGDVPVGPGWLRQVGFSPIDTTEATHLCFDLYISNAAALNGIQANIELCSSGRSDAEEHVWDRQYSELDLKDGWNYVAIPLSEFHASVGECDFTRVNWFRMFGIGTIKAGDELVTKLDNIRFEDRGISFYPGSAEEADYLYHRNSGGPNASNQKYWADGNSQVVYRFEIPENEVSYVTSVTWTFRTDAQLLLQVSGDGFVWETVYSYPFDPNGSPNQGMGDGVRTFDLTPYLDLTSSNSVWIRIADSYPSNGWGGNVKFSSKAELIWELDDRMQRADSDYYKFSVLEEERTRECGPFADLVGTEAQYLESTTNHKSGSERDRFRYNDVTRSTVYKFDLRNSLEVAKVIFSGRFGSQLLVAVSQDNYSWKTVHAGSVSTPSSHTFDLTEYLDMALLEETGLVYVKIGDFTPENGNGGRIYCGGETMLTVVHNPPPVEMNGAVAAMRRIFGNFKIFKNIPFLGRYFNAVIEVE